MRWGEDECTWPGRWHQRGWGSSARRPEVLFQPVPHVLPDPSRPALAYRKRLHKQRVVRPEAGPEVPPDLVGGPGGANEPGFWERPDAVLKHPKGSGQIRLPALVRLLKLERDHVARHGHPLLLSLCQ